MKKLLSLLLSFTMLISLISVTALAAPEEIVPIIFCPGYSFSQLYDTDTGEHIWGLTVEGVLQQAISDFPGLITGLTYMTEGEAYKLGQSVGKAGNDMFYKLKYNPDGTCDYNLAPHSTEAQYNSLKWLRENRSDCITDGETQRYLAELIGSDEYIFTCQIDFRQGGIGCAEQLRAFIEDVKDYTGADKVTLFGCSHGGETVGTYLSLYGTLGDIDRAFLSVPALGGTGTAVSALTATSHLNQDELISFAELALNSGSDFARILETTRIEVLDSLLQGFFSEFRETFKYWGSIWDFIPTDRYELLKSEFLTDPECAPVIAASDRMHYEVMENYNTNFKAAQDAGVKIAIQCNYGYELAFGSENNSDIIIDTPYVSGAKCAPIGMRFSDGYVKTGTNCTNPDHHHISPSMEIDASYAYLPDNTWFVDGQFHGMFYFEEYTRELISTFLLTDDITDVYSNPAYPQFETSNHEQQGIHVKFDNSSTGYLTSDDTALVIENLSSEHAITVTSVYCNGIDLDFGKLAYKNIPAGGEISLPFTGEVPEVSNCRASVVVDYFVEGALTSVYEKTFDITLLNGDIPAYNAAEPYSEVDTVDNLSQHIPSDLYDIFTSIGIKTDLTVLFNALSAIYDLVLKLMVMFE